MILLAALPTSSVFADGLPESAFAAEQGSPVSVERGFNLDIA